MDECVSRKETTEFINKCLEHEEKLQSVERETLIAVKKYLESIPAANVRPVVLCRDCKNWDTSWAPNCGKEYGHFCPMVGTVTGADWFCAYGERGRKADV